MSFRKNYKDFLLGTDSELLFCDKNGKLVPAAKYVTLKDKLGKDSNGITWECRSKPFCNPLDIVQNVKEIFQEAVNDNPNFYSFKWLCGSYCHGLPLGTHIHSNIKKNFISPQIYCQFLDNYVGAISLLLEDKFQGVNRRFYHLSPGGNPVSYGKMSDIRYAKHGMEYRSISSCLTSPHALSAILCLSKIVIFELLNNSSFSPKQYVNNEDFVSVNQNRLKRIFPNIWAEIRQMKLYPVYKKQLQIIPYLIDHDLSWNIKKDLKEVWGIVDPKNLKSIKPSPQQKQKFNFQELWQDWEF